MQVRRIDDVGLHRLRTPDDIARWRAGFTGAYQTVFGGPPYNERFFPSEAEGIYRRLTSTPGHVSIIAGTDDNVVAGFGISIPLQAKYDVSVELSGLVPLKHTMYLAEMGVLSEYRRRGLGAALVMERLRQIDADAYSHVVLRVSTDPENSSRGLYESLGFQDMGVYMEVSSMRVDGRVKTDRRLFLSKLLSQVELDDGAAPG